MSPADVTRNEIAYRMLGSFSVLIDGTPVACGGVKQRSVLAMLLLEPNRPVSTGRLIAGLWGDDPPNRALATIQVYVSALRRALPTVDGAPPIETTPNGYLVSVEPTSIDAARFSNHLDAADKAEQFRDHRLALSHLHSALGEWRGQPLADFEDFPFAAGPQMAWTQQREDVIERQFELRLQLGEHRSILPSLEAAVIDMPLRESVWRLLMIALYRSGRQADALAAFGRCREVLLDQLGIDPTPETQALQLAVLRQDPQLEFDGATQQPQRGTETVPAKPVPNLVLLLSAGQRHRLETDITLGRSDDCHIVIDEPEVSRRHAEIRRGPAGWILSDLSMNGTMVNGELCARHTMSAGDVIVIGNQPITVEVAEPALA